MPFSSINDSCPNSFPDNAEDFIYVHSVNAALGSNCTAAYPDHDKYDLEYEKKIELDFKTRPRWWGMRLVQVKLNVKALSVRMRAFFNNLSRNLQL